MTDQGKILVAGGTSFIGVNLICRLAAMGRHVRATVHERAPVIDSPLVEYQPADLRNMTTRHKKTNNIVMERNCRKLGTPVI